MIAALISQAQGISIFDDGTRVGVLDGRSEHVLRHISDHELAKLVSGASDMEALEVVDLYALRVHLRLRREREELLNAAVVLLDSGRSQRLRKIAGDSLSKDEFEQWGWVEDVLLSCALPPEADSIGASKCSRERAQFFMRLPRLSGKARMLRTALFALPDSAFLLESREQVLGKAVRKGLFGGLINGSLRSGANPFMPALSYYALSLELSVDDDAKETIAGQRGLEAVAPALEPMRHRWGWDIAPWRTAWLAADWPHFEAKVACTAAEELHDQVQLRREHLISGQEALFGQRKVIGKFFADWHQKSSKASLSDSLWLLKLAATASSAGFKAGSSTAHFEDLIKQVATFKASVDPDLTHFAGHGYGDLLSENPRSAPFSLLLNYLDVGALGAGSDSLQKVVAQYVQRLLNPLVPLDPDASQIGLHGDQLSGEITEKARAATMDLREVFCIYGLANRFNRNGCVVLSWADQRSPDLNRSGRHVLLANPKTETYLSTSGRLASVMEMMRERMAADVFSGVPLVRCGWHQVGDISAQIGGSWKEVARELRDAISRVGLSPDVVQEREEEVRFNPDLAATAGGSARKL